MTRPLRITPLTPVAIAALCALAIAATPSRGPSPRTVAASSTTVIAGTVFDERGAPIAAADVQVGASRAASRTDGRYALAVAHRGDGDRVVMHVTHAGYDARDLAVILRGDTVRTDVRLVASARPLVAGVREQAAMGAPATAPEVRADIASSNGRATKQAAPKGVRTGVGVALRRTGDVATMPVHRLPREEFNREGYEHLEENPFRSPTVAPRSTFSVDVDRASYSNVRRFLSRGTLPPRDAVRIEELVNYFPYNDAAPGPREAPLRVHTEIAAAPWNASHDLVRIALRARDLDMRRAPASNLVFLIDVSGSMRGPTRLPLVKQSLALLVQELREEDNVAIVVYAGNAGLVLPSTAGADKQRILAALDGLEAGGSTAGGAGIRLAYDIARQHFIRGGTNRVILCTDGDFNVGESSDGALVSLIEDRRREGSYLTILGFGMGNYRDATMEKLAGAGNGNYAYIDDLLEARKMLVHEMGGTLVTVAKDVKLQVEFNPARVQAYRLLGYEDRQLRDEDFTNDAKDAGDVGAGHTVTALYEIVRTDAPLDVSLPDAPALRYQRITGHDRADRELLHVALRYKAPDSDRSSELTYPVLAREPGERPSESMRFASAVAGFGMLLRHSPHAGTMTWSQVLTLARGAIGEDVDGYRADFIKLAETASRLSMGVAELRRE